MVDAVITEHAGTRHGSITRFYQYGSGGIRVLDDRKTLRRLYLFDHASNTMTENDPVRRDKVLRRFVFDPYGMLEETFSFGERPRTFKFEQGASRIAVREGGDYGAVGKLFTFEDNGVSETGWGRNGEIERVYIFEPGNDAIVERAGGWFGDIDRTIVFEGIGASVFREPESFLQFLMFTEWHPQEVDDTIERAAAEIRRGGNVPSGVPKSRYAYSGPRHASADMGGVRGQDPVARSPALQRDDRPARISRGSTAESGIDFIPDADSPAPSAPRGPPSRRSDSIPIEERRQQRDHDVQGRYTSVRSDEIALQERFERARGERGELSKGKSVEIPLEERFGSSRQDREPLSKGKSVEIPFEERFGSSRGEREKLSMGKSVEIPLEERFESARQDRKKLERGKSADIPYSERRGGSDR
ncbi:MAG: hypothetical protein WC586_04875 [Methanoregula sp.]